MGILTKRPIFDSSVPMYDFGLNTTVLIVGLGNPEKEYDGTRHNIGFAVVESFADKQAFDKWTLKKDLHCLQTTKVFGNTRVILCKPTTFMNESGRAVKAIQHFYKIDNSKTLVVYDELDINFGHLRTRIGGSSAGHNGVKSVTQACGEDYGRLRVGIGPKKPKQMDTSDFVLAKFSPKEVDHLPQLLQETNALLSEYAYGDGKLTTETRSFII
jgi:peptidyl-tRNA hydrolase, PTH1 family